MSVPKKKLLDTAWNTTTFLLTKQPEDFVDGHRVKIVIVGSGYTGVAIGIAILFKVCPKFLHPIYISNLILFRLPPLNFTFQKRNENLYVLDITMSKERKKHYRVNLRVFPLDDKRTKSGRNV